MALQDTSGADRDRARRPVSVLVVGAASRDLTPDDPRGWRLGGAVTYGALTLARLGLAVRAVIGADDQGAAASELDLLRDAGVAIPLVPLARGPVFLNEERAAGREQLAVEVADPMEVGAVPADWTATDALFLAPVAGELGPDWARATNAGRSREDSSGVGVGDGDGHAEDRGDARIVALGWQGLLRTLAPGEPVRRRPP